MVDRGELTGKAWARSEPTFAVADGRGRPWRGHRLLKEMRVKGDSIGRAEFTVSVRISRAPPARRRGRKKEDDGGTIDTRQPQTGPAIAQRAGRLRHHGGSRAGAECGHQTDPVRSSARHQRQLTVPGNKTGFNVGWMLAARQRILKIHDRAVQVRVPNPRTRLCILPVSSDSTNTHDNLGRSRNTGCELRGDRRPPERLSAAPSCSTSKGRSGEHFTRTDRFS